MPPDLQGLGVLMVGNWPPPIGGVSIHVRALRDAATKAGAQVRVLDIGHGQNMTDGVVPSGRPFAFAEALLRELRTADLVHLHTSGANPKSWILTTGVGLLASALKLPAIVTFHSGHGPRYLSTTSRALTARVALASYRHVICVSDEIARTLSRIGAAPRRHIVAPAFGLEGVAPTALPSQVQSALDGHSPILSAMLAPGRDYGARELFSAFSQFRRAHRDAILVVYGPGTDWLETRQLAATCGAESVVFLGQIERGTALGLVQASDVFIRPTLVDGDAVSIREAMALGRRVVATDVGSRPAGVTLCAPGNADALARALSEALSKVPSPPHSTDGIVTVLDLYARFVRLRRRRAKAA